MKLNHQWQLTVTVFLAACFNNLNVVRSELYTSLSVLEDALQSEQVLITNLGNFIEKEEKKLNSLKDKFVHYNEIHQKASANIENHLKNPINAFQMIKRLTADWAEVERITTLDNVMDMIRNVSMQKTSFKFPTEEDLNGAAIAIVRLQDVYHLSTTDVAQGFLDGVQYPTNMTVSDCFEIGKQMFKTGDYVSSIDWLREALKKFEAEKCIATDLKTNIFEFLVMSLQREGHIQIALSLTKKILKADPKDYKAKQNKGMLEEELRQLKKKGVVDEVELKDLKLVKTKFTHSKMDSAARSVYADLCQGKVTAVQSVSLNCKLERDVTPFLKLAPLKLEEIYQNPRIVMFHNVLSNGDIEFMKKIVKPKLRRSTVYNILTNTTESTSHRISKSGKLKDKEDDRIQVLSERVGSMTGLSIKTAEGFHMINYGIAGHYDPHYDFASIKEQSTFKEPVSGNRWATVLFYLTDVEQGGSTVFPSLRLTVNPKKGSALFWYNLRESGEEDLRTQHAACPILYGNKWISNKWLHDIGQGRCGLTPEK